MSRGRVSRRLQQMLPAVVLSLLVGGAGWVMQNQQAGSGPGQAPDGPKAVVGFEESHGLSVPLRELQPAAPTGLMSPQAALQQRPRLMLPHPGSPGQPDVAVQRTAGVTLMPSPTTSWDGINNTNSGCTGCIPPDPNMAVGQSQTVQAVNVAFQVWNKSGTSLYGPVTISTIWSGTNGACQNDGMGDPIVLYDSLANRWLISQFAFTLDSKGVPVPPFYECIAISQTSDATGAWYHYTFQVSATDLMDYPKFGIWPDGYYMSANDFSFSGNCYPIGGCYEGPRAFVFNRSSMLAGQQGSFQMFSSLGNTHYPILPADLGVALAPASGEPNYFVEFPNVDASYGTYFYKLHVDWTNSANSTFTQYATVNVAPFTQLCPTTQNCISQLGTTQKLDGIGDRLMQRLVYMNFGTYESLLVNHTVDATGTGIAGVRWYEFRNLSTTPTVYQQGTYAPDSNSRWMGSMAMDLAGNIAVGYSKSSSSIYPSINYAGRLASDPLNNLSQGEATLFNGQGSQFLSGVSIFNRWGDYTAMTVDPVDRCTFWYTNEYYLAPSLPSANYNWHTRIGSFKFPAPASGQVATPSPIQTAVRLPYVASHTPCY